MMQNTFEEGRLLLINKPKNLTSFDVVKKLRATLKVKKIGHAGTLDPLATGLLLIGTGKLTKKLNHLQGLDKVYRGVIEIGKITASYDLETPPKQDQDYHHLTEADFEKARLQFLGNIQQVPPAHSAVRINGERAYKKARKNEPVLLKPRLIYIDDFQIDYHDLPNIKFEVKCSKGTYIRSLAHDFGQSLGVGAYLKSLIRVSVGDYQLNDAEDLDDFLKNHNANNEYN